MLNWIFPCVCELCGAPAKRYICDQCVANLPYICPPICMYCGTPTQGAQDDPYRCPACSGRARSFDFARSALKMSESTRQLIHRLKYKRGNYLAPSMALILNQLWEKTPALMERNDWWLIPVPSGTAHLYSRGYNQAEELARCLGRLRGLGLLSPLKRLKKGADSQTHLAASQRWRNALSSFVLRSAWANGHRKLPPHLVLVDDVYTTGSTVRACAHLLKQLPSVKTVAVLTLIRAVHG